MFSCYLYLGDTSTINCVVAAIGKCPRGADILVDEDFNVDLVAPEGNQRGYCR